MNLRCIIIHQSALPLIQSSVKLQRSYIDSTSVDLDFHIGLQVTIASRFATLKLIDETRFAPDPADVEEEEVDEEDEDEQQLVMYTPTRLLSYRFYIAT